MNDTYLFRLTKEDLQTTALIKMGKRKIQNRDPQETSKWQQLISEEKIKSLRQKARTIKTPHILETKCWRMRTNYEDVKEELK